MAQHDYDVPNGRGNEFRAEINRALAAIQSVNSGASAPSDTVAGMLWYDTQNDRYMRRNSTNTAWVKLVPQDQAAQFPYGSHRRLPGLKPGPVFYRATSVQLAVRGGTTLYGHTYEENTNITMPTTMTAGSYLVRQDTANGDLVIVETRADAAPAGPVTTEEIIVGGFEWVPGVTPAGTDAEILEHSIWDAGWRPVCDPRGMTLVGELWVDIYLTSKDCVENTGRSSVYGHTVMDGGSGRGPNGWSSYTYRDAIKLAASLRKRLPHHEEFGAYQRGSANGQQTTTAETTAAWANLSDHVAQSRGVKRVFGSDIRTTSYVQFSMYGNSSATSSWYQELNWAEAWTTDARTGSRFVAEHQML